MGERVLHIRHAGWGEDWGIIGGSADCTELELAGHTQGERPRTGDLLILYSRRGTAHSYRVTNHDHPSDPRDQWFATVRFEASRRSEGRDNG